jgi:histidinol-phosphate/aromatic aminotransferase/cobyric acid decarboxylase-like protein/N-acyl-L-homoserine lactone synthetase
MSSVRISVASEADRESIYRLRHEVYAGELGQHPANAQGRLSDPLDRFNDYLVATSGTEILGFVSITPPGHGSYSIDKYFSRTGLPFAVDTTLYEVRLLTVPAHRRGRAVAVLLMYAAYRWIVSRGGTRIVAIGRRELRDLYRKAGLEVLGQPVRAGAVTYELMTATIAHLQGWMSRFDPLLRNLEKAVLWDLEVPFFEEGACFHGGAFFEAIGETFESLDRSTRVINADVLDAWFPPAPGVVGALQEYLPWLLRTSPPQDAGGLVRTIAEARRVPADSIAVGAGSSSLIYLAFREWLTRESRVLLPEPTYGEYAHILERVIGCRPERLPLSRAEGYRIDLGDLLSRIAGGGYELVVLVNPNNPTGRLLPRSELEPVLSGIPEGTRLWVDEAYIDYAGTGESVEATAAHSSNVVVCKSLSKVYALSGARAAYLCGDPSQIRKLRSLTPPWAVGLPAQVAAVFALRDPAYYAGRYQETARLRAALVSSLRRAIPTIDVWEGMANFVLCHLSPEGPDAATVCQRCRARDVFLRDASSMSRHLGRHTLRIAVKDQISNRKVVRTLAEAITAPERPRSRKPVESGRGHSRRG